MVSVMNGKETSVLASSYEQTKHEKEDLEKLVFKYIAENNYNELRSLFSQYKLKANIYDKDGMTPLQHACYKRNKDIVELLLEQVSFFGSLYKAFVYVTNYYFGISVITGSRRKHHTSRA